MSLCESDDRCHECQEGGCVYCKFDQFFVCVQTEEECITPTQNTTFTVEMEEKYYDDDMIYAELDGLIVSICEESNPNDPDAQLDYESPPLPEWFYVLIGIMSGILFCIIVYRIRRFCKRSKKVYCLHDHGTDFRMYGKLSYGFIKSMGETLKTKSVIHFSKGNDLDDDSYFALMRFLKNSQHTIVLDSDFCNASKSTLLALAHLLRECRKNIKFRQPKLWLKRTDPRIIDEILKSLPYILSLDEVCFDLSKIQWAPVPLSQLRTCTEKVEIGQHIGDFGAAGVCAYLTTIPRLTHLTFRGCGLVMPRLDSLFQLNELEELNLTSNKLGDKFAKAGGMRLGKLKLKRLSLDDNEIGPSGVKHLKFSKVEEMILGSYVGGNPIGDVGAKHLGDLIARTKKLQVLKLNNCGICWRGAESIAEAMGKAKALKYLSLDNNPIADRGGHCFVAAFRKDRERTDKKRMDHIEEISLNCTSLTDDSCLALSMECPETMRINMLSNTISQMLLKTLMQNPSTRPKNKASLDVDNAVASDRPPEPKIEPPPASYRKQSEGHDSWRNRAMPPGINHDSKPVKVVKKKKKPKQNEYDYSESSDEDPHRGPDTYRGNSKKNTARGWAMFTPRTPSRPPVGSKGPGSRPGSKYTTPRGK